MPNEPAFPTGPDAAPSPAPATEGPAGASPAPGPSLRAAVERCRQDEPFLAGLRAILAEADAHAAAGKARCWGGGCCCKFDLAGHRLYLSSGELALLGELAPPQPGQALRRRCPYQLGPRCLARDRRPLGCRTHFCQGAPPDASSELYEGLHRRIRLLHRRHALPYLYAELTGALSELLGLS